MYDDENLTNVTLDDLHLENIEMMLDFFHFLLSTPYKRWSR